MVARRTPTASDADDTVAPLTASMSRLRRSGSWDVFPWNCLRKRTSRTSSPRGSRYTMISTRSTIPRGDKRVAKVIGW